MLTGLMKKQLFRGVIATLVACTGAFVADLAQRVPHWLSPSNRPVRFWSLLTNLPSYFLVNSIMISIWLVPVCLVLQQIMARRGYHGTRASIVLGLAASIFAWGALFVFPIGTVLSNPNLSTLDIAWDRLVGTGAACSIFLVAWLVCFDILAKGGVADAAPETRPRPSERWRAVRTLIEGLPAGGALVSISIWGLVAGAFLSDDGHYRPAFTVDSPQRTTRAHIVEYLRPGGGCRTGVDQEIYLLPSSESWSSAHRGLLIWRGNNLWRGSHSRELDVAWETERLLTVRAPYDTTRSGIDRREAFVRDGFTARTVNTP